METKKELFTALVKAQVELKNPQKNKEGYGYKYATLDSIIEQSKPVLAKYGLCVVQTLAGDGTKVGVTTAIVHESGESIIDTLWLPATDMKGVNAVQAIGASITYGRRYALSAILGISADDDTDAATPHKNRPNSSDNQEIVEHDLPSGKTQNKAEGSPNSANIDIIPIGKSKGQKWSDQTVESLKRSLKYYDDLILANPGSPYKTRNEEVVMHIQSILTERGK